MRKAAMAEVSEEQQAKLVGASLMLGALVGFGAAVAAIAKVVFTGTAKAADES